MRWPLWLKTITYLFSLAFALLMLVHVLVNHQRSLRFILTQIKNITGTDIQTSQISFNGFTGYFNGDALRVVSAKKKFELELGNFKLRLNASKLFFGELEIEDIQSNKFNLKFSAQEKPKDKLKVDFISDLLDSLFLSKADLQNVSITSVNKYTVSSQQVILKAGYPLFFSERSLEATCHKTSLQATKMDLFVQKIYFDGTISPKSTLTPFRSQPGLEGRIELSQALFGFSKKTNPWSNNPGYDKSLAPKLKESYGDTIPDNRTFAYLESALIPFEFERDQILTDSLVINAFNGQIKGSASWLNGKVVVNLGSTQKLSWGLLPLGKSNLRLAYQDFDFNLQAKGTFNSLSDNKLSGKLTADLSRSLVYPEAPGFSLSVPFELNQGTLGSDLKLTLGDGQLSGKARINANTQTLTASLNGTNLDSRAVIRLFSSIDIPGKANLSGDISGSLLDPVFDLKISSPQFGYESLTAGSFEGQLKIKEQKMTLEGNTQLKETGSGKLKLAIDHVFKSSEQQVDLEANFDAMPAGALLNSEVIDGSVSGKYKLSKNNQVYSGGGEVHFKNGKWYSIPILGIDFNLKQEDKYLYIEKSIIHWNEATAPITNNGRLAFHFLPDGSYTFTGPITPQATLTGAYTAPNPTVEMTVALKKSPLEMLKPLINSGDKEPVSAGNIKIIYALGKPENSTVEAKVDFFDFLYKEHPLRLLKPATIGYSQKKITLDKVPLLFGRGNLDLNGVLGLVEASNLKIKGDLDAEAISEFTPFLIEGYGLAKVDLDWIGPYVKAAFKGKINLVNNELRLRQISGELSELTGSVELDGDKITLGNLKGFYAEAPVTLNGWLSYNPQDGIYAADLALKGTEFSATKADTWRVLTDLDIRLLGSNKNLKLSGAINLIEGSYFRDYSISSFILKPVGVSYPNDFQFPEWAKNMALDLKVKSSGEFVIDNNVSEISLKGDIALKGSATKPEIIGTIDVLDGAIHAFGLDFEDARGFINFSVSDPFVPFIDFSASQEIQNYLVKALIKGKMDNLEMSFESQPALNKNEVVSLIAFGRTPDQLNQSDKNLFSRSAIASQLVSIFQRPLSKATHLDIVKLDSNDIDNEALLTELSIGKRLSDRVTFAFTTDLSLDQAYKGVVLEYQFLDNLLLKGSKDTGSKYRFNLAWRLEAY